MLHSLHIMLHITLGNTGKLQKIGQDPVSMPDCLSDLSPCFGENKATVLFVVHKSFRIKSFDHVCNAGLRDSQTSCNIDNPGITLGINEFLNPFQIVFNSG